MLLDLAGKLHRRVTEGRVETEDGGDGANRV
jgi:hypothetical protein